MDEQARGGPREGGSYVDGWGTTWRRAPGGEYIPAPAHAVQADVPVENIMALVEVMQSR